MSENKQNPACPRCGAPVDIWQSPGPLDPSPRWVWECDACGVTRKEVMDFATREEAEADVNPRVTGDVKDLIIVAREAAEGAGYCSTVEDQPKCWYQEQLRTIAYNLAAALALFPADPTLGEAAREGKAG